MTKNWWESEIDSMMTSRSYSVEIFTTAFDYNCIVEYILTSLSRENQFH